MLILVVVLTGVAASILLAGFFSGMETAAYRGSTVRLRSLAAEGDGEAERSLRMLQSIPAVITTTLIGHNISVYLATYILTDHLESVHVPEAEVIATLGLTPICFIFAETLPKRIGHLQANVYLLRGIRTTDYARILFTPLGAILGAFAHVLQLLLTRMGFHSPSATGRKRLLEYFEASLAEDVLSETQHEIVERIMAIQDQAVRNVMIPIGNAVVIPEDLTCREAARLILEAGRNRAALVDRSGQPSGRLVTANDVMRNPASLDQPVVNAARQMLAFNANTLVSKALRRMRQEHARLALVTGRNGTPIGVVTASDLLGAIVGATHL